MMKLEKKQILSALAVLCFGAAVSFVNLAAGSEGIAGNAAGSVQLTADLAVDDIKAVEESGEVRIDFAELKARNQDVYAWITVPGTRVDYPVLQKGDSEDPYDDYYLNHTMDLVEGFPGSIYSHAASRTDFMDPVTVLYGHNLKDGGMFSSLHEFEDEDFFEENRQVIIYMPDSIITYEIIAAVDFSDAFIPYTYDFSDPAQVSRYLADVEGCEGNFREEVEVSEGDKILTLSTCYSGRDDRRFLIVAVMSENIRLE